MSEHASGGEEAGALSVGLRRLSQRLSHSSLSHHTNPGGCSKTKGKEQPPKTLVGQGGLGSLAGTPLTVRVLSGREASSELAEGGGSNRAGSLSWSTAPAQSSSHTKHGGSWAVLGEGLAALEAVRVVSSRGSRTRDLVGTRGTDGVKGRGMSLLLITPAEARKAGEADREALWAPAELVCKYVPAGTPKDFGGGWKPCRFRGELEQDKINTIHFS